MWTLRKEARNDSYVPAKLAVKLGQGKGHLFAQGENVYVQHAQIASGASTGWHSHAGPVIVLMVNGTLTLYNGDDKSCTGHPYGPGNWFVDAGFGHLHIARNEGTVPAEFYAVYLLPNGSGDAGVELPQATSPTRLARSRARHRGSPRRSAGASPLVICNRRLYRRAHGR